MIGLQTVKVSWGKGCLSKTYLNRYLDLLRISTSHALLGKGQRRKHAMLLCEFVQPGAKMIMRYYNIIVAGEHL